MVQPDTHPLQISTNKRSHQLVILLLQVNKGRVQHIIFCAITLTVEHLVATTLFRRAECVRCKQFPEFTLNYLVLQGLTLPGEFGPSHFIFYWTDRLLGSI